MKTKYMRESLFSDRMYSLLNCLNGKRYAETVTFDDLLWGECTLDSECTDCFSDDDVDYKKLVEGFTFSGYDKYWWVKVNNFTVPNWQDKKVVVRVVFQKQTDEWEKGTEGLVILNGKPWQGTDQNHLEVFLPKDACGKPLDFKIRYWTGANNHDIKHHKFHYGNISVLDEVCDELYFKVKNMIQAVNLAPKDSADAVVLIKALDEIHRSIDINNPTKEQLENSLFIAKSALNSKEVTDVPLINVIGHTHIDVAWQWKFKHTREKSLRSFSTVMRLMELYPEYKFLQSTPQLYEFIREDYPQLFEDISTRIAEKRWECEGGMWVEADCNIPSGESLARQFLYGKKYFRQMFNYDSKILWLPDVFGYNWALPQLMKKSGIDYFMTTKISWNQYNRMPNETFMWRGIDGSEVLTHFINTPEEGLSDDNIFRTYNGMITPFTSKKMWEDYTNKELNTTLLNSYGYGDGGGGVNREMLENARVLENLPSIPKVKQNFAIDFFNTLNETVHKNKNYLNTWDGELYFELHRGTYTSQSFIKRENRKLEYKLRNLEILVTNKFLLENNFDWFDFEKYDKCYKQFLTNQFHDIIPGTSIREVYDDVRVFCDEFNKYIDNETRKLLISDNQENVYSVVNLNDCEYKQKVFIPESREGYFESDNEKLISSKVENGYMVFVTVPALSSLYVNFVESKINTNSPFAVDNEKLETPYYNVVFENGVIVDLYDKVNNRQVSDGSLGQLAIYEDIPIFWDSWDIEIHHKYKGVALYPDKTSIKSCDELQIIFTTEYKTSEFTILQDIIFYSNSALIEFDTKVDYNARQKLLKVNFNVDVRATVGTYDIQFGNVKRPTTSNNDWEMAQFECVAHRYVELSDNGYGVALINDCKYGHIIKDNNIELTLIKGGIFPDKEADIGKHIFKYALYPHNNNVLNSDVINVSESYNNPPLVVKGKTNFDMPFVVKNKNIAVSCIKKATDNDDLIVRLYENSGSKTTVDLSKVFENYTMTLCNIIEDDIRVISEDERSKVVFKPYEINTFKFSEI